MKDIRVFPGDARRFDRGGTVIAPLRAELVEEAGGDWRLTVTCARDDRLGRHRLLKCGSLLYAPANGKNRALRGLIPGTGTVTLLETRGRPCSRTVRGENGPVTQTGRGSVELYENAASDRVLHALKSGSRVRKLADAGARFLCLTEDGQAGYIDTELLIPAGETEGNVWLPGEEKRTAPMQPFRIESVTAEDGRTVTVEARHVYFDAAAGDPAPVSFLNAPLAEVCAYLTEVNGGGVTFLAGAESYVTAELEGTAAAMAAALCEKYDLQLLRDGWQACLMPGGATERCFTARPGKDLRTLRVTRDDSETVTRFIPCTEEEEFEPVISSRDAEYAVKRELRVTGETEEAAREKIAALIAAGWDRPEYTVLLSPSPGAADTVCVYDAVRVTDPLTGIRCEGRVNRVSHDPLKHTVTGLGIGRAGERLSGELFRRTEGSWEQVTEE